MRFSPWNRKQDPLVVTLLPTANLSTKQDQRDAELLLEYRAKVAENIRTKGPERQRKADDLRQRYAEAQRLRYFKQAS